ncbi:hypothetical protein Tco_0635179 [Tanacetum coccineum]
MSAKGFCSGGGGGGSVDVVSVVSVTLEGTSADAVRALKIWFLSFFCLSKDPVTLSTGLNLNPSRGKIGEIRKPLSCTVYGNSTTKHRKLTGFLVVPVGEGLPKILSEGDP